VTASGDAYAVAAMVHIILSISSAEDTRMRFRLVPSAVLYGIAVSGSLPVAGQAPITRSYVTMLGRDTLGFEQYTRSGNVITGDIIARTGGTVVNHYVVTLAPNGMATRLEYTQRKPDGSVPRNAPQSVTVTFGPESMTMVVMRDSAITRTVAVTDPYLLIGNSIAFYEILLTRLRSLKTDSSTVIAVGTNIAPNATRAGQPYAVKFFTSDSARIWTPTYMWLLRVDEVGQILGFSGRATTSKIEVRPTARFDVAKVAAAFAAAEAAGTAVATGSARDSVRATVGNAHIAVDYFRPLTRGRDVWKNGVLGDTIWRTGANDATMFKTDVDLVIEGKTIPAGAYTLWTHVRPDNSAYELIVNKQTGQWGTVYRVEQDLVRVPLRVSKLASPVEAFLIRVEPASAGGVIKLQWAATELSVPFAIK
jgi:hypothetical protein